MKSIYKLSLALLLVLGLSVASSHAQIVGATITGTVHDSSGAALSSATVTVKQIETGLTRKVITDAEGRFFAPSVPIGPYTITAEHEGFAPSEQAAAVVLGQSLQLKFVLGVASVQQAIEVTADSATVNTSTQQTAGLVDERQVKELPLNGRSYDGLMTLNPRTVNYSSQRAVGVGTSNSSVG
ncbi:MAG: carboxypeptidase regulatory-like domain-containing protein, partial [Acidobacteriales bacterium]|nr:carboxypeptidase regulatory-like domain-containing protein [Terriglobales bacterium]